LGRSEEKVQLNVSKSKENYLLFSNTGFYKGIEGTRTGPKIGKLLEENFLGNDMGKVRVSK